MTGFRVELRCERCGEKATHTFQTQGAKEEYLVLWRKRHAECKEKEKSVSWPQRVQKLREARGERCEFGIDSERRCRVRANLEFAHIKRTGLNGRGRGQTQRYRDIEQNPECYMLLCKKHHKMVGDPADWTPEEKRADRSAERMPF